ncbi:MAG: YncE family protein [Acidobacteriia bacterium]|nr:YncE family protein [Terriglobia bacterium]
MALTPDGTRAYVSNSLGGTVSVIDTASNTVIATISVGRFLGPAAVTPDGKSVYVPGAVEVAVISTATNSVVSRIPTPAHATAVAITPDGTRAYAVGTNNVVVIDTATNTVLQSIGVSSSVSFFPAPIIAITPGGDTVYVGGGNSPVVQAIATASNTVVATIPIPGSFVFVGGLAITPDGSRVYVSNGFDAVSIIDTATNTLEPSPIQVGQFSAGVAVTPDGASVYVANQGSNNVSVISTATNTVVATVPAGFSPFAIAIANLSTPFSRFAISGLSVNKNGFTESGTFTLGANSSGLDLAAQPLTITVDNFTLTIPAGSFKQVGGNMHFVFSGTINGLPVSMTLMATGSTNNSFKYSVAVNGVDLTGQPNPATVGLQIGENTGSTTAPF